MSTPENKPASEASDASIETGAKKPKKKLIIILTLLLLIAGGAGAAWMLIPHKAEGKDAAARKAESAPVGPPVFVVMEPFTVNLQPDGQFLQATVTLQIANADESGSIKLYLPQVRSRLLLMLSNKTVTELSTVEGKTKLSAEIASLIEQPFASGVKPVKISNVFFTSFVIQ